MKKFKIITMTQGTKIHTCECGWQGSEKEMVFRDGDQISQWECPDCLQVISNDLQPKDESKEVKEVGEWIADTAFQEYRRDGDKDADYYTCFVFVKETGGKDKLCDVYGDTKEEAEERASIIAQSKNMYYALLNLVTKGVQATGQDYQNAIDILDKATKRH